MTRVTESPELAAARLLFTDGAFTVKQTAARTPFSRQELWDLMDAGVLPWMPIDGKKTRAIPWSAVVDHMARMYVAHKTAARI